MANNPYVNKVQLADGTTLIDLTNTTAGAGDVVSGKYFFAASGALTLGTYSGGGSVTQDQDGFIVLPPDGGGTPIASGLKYETGTWSPSEDVTSAWISLTGTYTVAPFYYMIADTTVTYSDTTSTNYVTIYCNFHQLFGDFIDTNNGGTKNYGYAYARYRSTSTTSLTGAAQSITEPYTYSSDSSVTFSRYWAQENKIKAYSNSDSRYWRAGRTYKWIAVWAPTT